MDQQVDLQIAGKAKTGYVLPLREINRRFINAVGSKAANLGELAQAGFPVPDGFAITTQAFDDFVEFNGLDETQTPDEVARAAIPPAVEEALRLASANLDGVPLAVSSSGVAEDLDGARHPR